MKLLKGKLPLKKVGRSLNYPTMRSIDSEFIRAYPFHNSRWFIQKKSTMNVKSEPNDEENQKSVEKNKYKTLKTLPSSSGQGRWWVARRGRRISGVSDWMFGRCGSRVLIGRRGVSGRVEFGRSDSVRGGAELDLRQESSVGEHRCTETRTIGQGLKVLSLLLLIRFFMKEVK